MAIYKIPRNPDQNPIDICTNYANLDRIYDFLELNEIDYTFAGQLEKDFITLDDQWIRPSSNFLIQNKNTVVTGDEKTFYPNTHEAQGLIYDKNVLEDFTYSNSGSNYTLSFGFRNYGYGIDTDLTYVMLYTGSTLIDSKTFLLDSQYGELINTGYTVSLPSGKTITAKIFSTYKDYTMDVGSQDYSTFKTPPTNYMRAISGSTDTLELVHYSGSTGAWTGHTYYLVDSFVYVEYLRAGDQIIVEMPYYTNYPSNSFYLYVINSSGAICSDLIYLQKGDFSPDRSEASTFTLNLNNMANNDLGIKLVMGCAVTTSVIIDLYDKRNFYASIVRPISKGLVTKTFFT